jgi:hypothetical protein
MEATYRDALALIKASYERYSTRWDENDAWNKAQAKRMEEKMQGTPLAGAEFSVFKADDDWTKKSFEEWFDYECKSDERRMEKERQEAEERLHYAKVREEAIKKNEEEKNVIAEYLATLPQTYTPKEWREKAKTLPLKKYPIPRGTISVVVSKQGENSVHLKYNKS